MPQSSVLGLILFLIYIIDVSNNLSDNVWLFADDCVIYRQINSYKEFNALQTDLNSISSWCDHWQMKIIASKTNGMTFTRTINLHLNSCSINNSVIENVTTLKYLGVYLSPNLTWNEHIGAIVSKPSKTLDVIKRNLHLASQSTKLLAYSKLGVLFSTVQIHGEL